MSQCCAVYSVTCWMNLEHEVIVYQGMCRCACWGLGVVVCINVALSYTAAWIMDLKCGHIITIAACIIFFTKNRLILTQKQFLIGFYSLGTVRCVSLCRKISLNFGITFSFIFQ